MLAIPMVHVPHPDAQVSALVLDGLRLPGGPLGCGTFQVGWRFPGAHASRSLTETSILGVPA